MRAPGSPYDFGQFELDIEPWSDDGDFEPVLAKKTLPVLA